MEQIHEACVGGIIENGACTGCGFVIEENDTPTPPQEPTSTPEESDSNHPNE